MTELLDRATPIGVPGRRVARQDRAKCLELECDWSGGWDLEYAKVVRWATEHQSETGHRINYRVQLTTHEDHHYVIEAEAQA